MVITQNNSKLTQRDLVEKLDISVYELNHHIKHLVENGLVKMRNLSNSENEFGYVYLLTTIGMT